MTTTVIFVVCSKPFIIATRWADGQGVAYVSGVGVCELHHAWLKVFVFYKYVRMRQNKNLRGRHNFIVVIKRRIVCAFQLVFVWGANFMKTSQYGIWIPYKDIHLYTVLLTKNKRFYRSIITRRKHGEVNAKFFKINETLYSLYLFPKHRCLSISINY